MAEKNSHDHHECPILNTSSQSSPSSLSSVSTCSKIDNNSIADQKNSELPSSSWQLPSSGVVFFIQSKKILH